MKKKSLIRGNSFRLTAFRILISGLLIMTFSPLILQSQKNKIFRIDSLKNKPQLTSNIKKQEKQEKKSILEFINTTISALGAIITACGVIYAGIQLNHSKKITRSQFLIHIYELMETHNEIHICLTKTGFRKNEKDKFCPRSPDEWVKVGRIMGLFEYIWILTEDHILDINTVDLLYSYRIVPIVNNPYIIERHLQENNNTWKGLKFLLNKLEKEEMYSVLKTEFLRERNNFT